MKFSGTLVISGLCLLTVLVILVACYYVIFAKSITTKNKSQGNESTPKSDTCFLATSEENAKPVVLRARNALPEIIDLKAYQWLAVIKWTYKAKDNGMPLKEEDDRMYELETILETYLEEKAVCFLMVSRTGNGYREWEYHTKNRDEFMKELNRAVSDKPKYPIEISFYEDPNWDSFKKILGSKNSLPESD